MALSLDGFASSTVGTGGAASSASVTLTTSQTNDIIVVAVHWFMNTVVETGLAGPPCVSAMSGAGLQWAIRSRIPLHTSFTPAPGLIETFDIWWAVAPSALSAQTITATLLVANAALNYGEMFAFGVNGADLLLPWDTNASLPAIAAVGASGGSGNHTVAGISTTNASVMQLNFLAFAAASSGTQTLDAGFTTLGQLISSTSFSALLAEYKILSSPLSSASQNVFAATSAVTKDYISVVDFIKAGPTTTWAGPTYVNSGALSAASATALTPALPSNRTNGNLLLAFCDITDVTAAPTWSAGWTVVETWHGGGGSDQTGTKAWRYVTGSETAPTITFNVAATGSMAQVHQFANVSQSSPIGASQHNTGTASTSITCSPLTTTAVNSLIFNFVDVGQLSPLQPPPKWTGASAGAGGPPSTFGAAAASWELAPTSGTTSDSVAATPAFGASIDWLNFITEILSVPVPYVPPPPTKGKGGGKGGGKGDKGKNLWGPSGDLFNFRADQLSERHGRSAAFSLSVLTTSIAGRSFASSAMRAAAALTTKAAGRSQAASSARSGSVGGISAAGRSKAVSAGLGSMGKAVLIGGKSTASSAAQASGGATVSAHGKAGAMSSARAGIVTGAFMAVAGRAMAMSRAAAGIVTQVFSGGRSTGSSAAHGSDRVEIDIAGQSTAASSASAAPVTGVFTIAAGRAKAMASAAAGVATRVFASGQSSAASSDRAGPAAEIEASGSSFASSSGSGGVTVVVIVATMVQGASFAMSWAKGRLNATIANRLRRIIRLTASRTPTNLRGRKGDEDI